MDILPVINLSHGNKFPYFNQFHQLIHVFNYGLSSLIVNEISPVQSHTAEHVQP